MTSSLNRVFTLGIAASALVLSVGGAAAKVVGDGKLENYCAEEAMIRLNVGRGEILMLPTELSKGRYFVYGQTPAEGSNVTTFECQFSSKKVLTSVKINGKAAPALAAPAAAAAPSTPPKAALGACTKRLGVAAAVKQVSPLKPGYQEIILQAKSGKRKVACTVSDDGSIEDWVEMR